MQFARTAAHRFVVFAITLVLLIALSACSFGGSSTDTGTDANSPSDNSSTSGQSIRDDSPANSDDTLALLFENHESGVQVRGEGIVLRLLEDDTKGAQHQRFILQLKSGQTLLVAHNIEVAPRLDGLAVGDVVTFYGEYYYNEQGGGIHWTHHDSSRKHEDGWLYWDGSYFE